METSITSWLELFILLKCVEFMIEIALGYQNQRFFSDPTKQKKAQDTLGISPSEMQETFHYTMAKYRFGILSSVIEFSVTMAFLLLGGLGIVEQSAQSAAQALGFTSMTAVGVIFLVALSLLSYLLSLPFQIYFTFHIEEKFGFNRQTWKGFVADQIKAGFLSAVLILPISWVILKIVESAGPNWWIWAWVVVTGFSLFTSWIYPRVLAPLFNKFRPLEDGSLKEKIEKLAVDLGFRASGIYIMDASKRSSHGNAYFTGLFGEKRIVLFDTLINNLSESEIIGVLAHELGHFKLSHVRNGMIRGIAYTGMLFFIMSLGMSYEPLYQAFALSGVTSYGTLVVFALWFGVISFALNPLSSMISQKQEFDADAFAKKTLGSSIDLKKALLKLREKSRAMPLSHPLYSIFHHSHPTLLRRLEAMD